MLDEVIPKEDGCRRKVTALPPRKIDVTSALRAGDGHQCNVRVIHILPGLHGDKRNTDTGTHQLPHRFGAVAFQHHIGIKARHLAVGIGDAAQVFSFLQADELLVGDLVQCKHIKMCQRISNRQRQTDLFFDKGGAIGAGDRLGIGEKGKIAALLLIAHQVFLQNVQADIAVLFLKATHQARDEGRCRIHRKGDVHGAVITGIVDFPLDGFQLLEDAVGMVQHDNAVFIQLDAFAAAVEQFDAKFLFQHPDGAAEGRLRHMKFLGCFCDMFQFCCPLKIAQMCNLHESYSI